MPASAPTVFYIRVIFGDILGTYWGYIEDILRLYWGYIGDTLGIGHIGDMLGLYRGCMGVMENRMATSA